MIRKTEVYQIRLDAQEKKQAFAVFKQLGITPAQAVRLFFKQVVLTKSIPFAIENQAINLDAPKKKSAASSVKDEDHDAFFEELNALLGADSEQSS